MANERLPLRQPVIYDQLALPVPRSPPREATHTDTQRHTERQRELSESAGGPEHTATVAAANTRRCASRLLWERPLRCELLRCLAAAQVDNAVLVVDRDGARVGVMAVLADAEEEEGGEWIWRHAAPGNSSLILSAAVTSTRAIQGADGDSINSVGCVSLLALGDGKLIRGEGALRLIPCPSLSLPPLPLSIREGARCRKAQMGWVAARLWVIGQTWRNRLARCTSVTLVGVCVLTNCRPGRGSHPEHGDRHAACQLCSGCS